MTNDAYLTQGHQQATGHWAHRTHAAAQVTLTPEVSTADLQLWLGRNGKTISDDGLALFAERVNAAANDNDFTRADLFREVYIEVNGYTEADESHYFEAIELLSANGRTDVVEGLNRYIDGSRTPSAAVQSRSSGRHAEPAGAPEVRLLRPTVSNPRVQAGEVFDTVVSDDGTEFHRVRDGVRPEVPSSIRIQADTPLSDEEVTSFADILGYSYAVNLSGDGLSDPKRDSPYSFVVTFDLTKARRSVGSGFDRLESTLTDYLDNGTVIRQGRGGVEPGSQAVPPFPGRIGFELYYDDVDIEDDAAHI